MEEKDYFNDPTEDLDRLRATLDQKDLEIQALKVQLEKAHGRIGTLDQTVAILDSGHTAYQKIIDEACRYCHTALAHTPNKSPDDIRTDGPNHEHDLEEIIFLLSALE